MQVDDEAGYGPLEPLSCGVNFRREVEPPGERSGRWVQQAPSRVTLFPDADVEIG
jgi:hypothetical protein